ncbi:MAG: hypothetical protein GY757_52830, partial [bacterium]|nr:hypothetical protein [bacterium]
MLHFATPGEGGPATRGRAGLLGEVYIASTKNGNLLVGGSVYPELTVYSTEGKKLKTIPLDMKPVT